jgi:hypothetical protein
MEIRKEDKQELKRLIKSREFEELFSGNIPFVITMEVKKDKEVQIILSPVASGLHKVDLYGYEDMPEDDLVKVADMVNKAIEEVYGDCSIYEGVAKGWQYLNYPN